MDMRKVEEALWIVLGAATWATAQMEKDSMDFHDNRLAAIKVVREFLDTIKVTDKEYDDDAARAVIGGNL